MAVEIDKFKSMLVQQTKDGATPTEIIPIATTSSTEERAAGDDRFIERAQVSKEYIDFLALVRSKHGPGSQIFEEICSEIAPLLKANVNGMVSQGTGGTGLPYQTSPQEAVETSLQSIGRSLGEALATTPTAEGRTKAGDESFIDASTNSVTLSEEESPGASLPSLDSLSSIRERHMDEWTRGHRPPSREETQEHMADVERQLQKLFAGAKTTEERLKRLAEL